MLERFGYDSFLPTRTVRRQWSDRVKTFEEPLFPGYLFCRFDPQDRLRVLTAPRVISIGGFGRQLVPVADDEIETIRTMLNSPLRADLHPYLKTGQRVRIEGGALAGVEGLLIAVRNEYRVVASITILQRSASSRLTARLRRL